MTDFCCRKARENLLPTNQHNEQENMQSVCSDYVVRAVGDFLSKRKELQHHNVLSDITLQRT